MTSASHPTGLPRPPRSALARPAAPAAVSPACALDDRGPSESGHLPYGAPSEGTAPAAGCAASVEEPGCPLAQPGWRGAAGKGNEGPGGQVKRDQRGGEVAAGEPDAVAGSVAVVDGVAVRADAGVLEDEVGP